MELEQVSRRLFLGHGALITLAIVLVGCTKTVTKYRPDGTAYTEEQDDPVATLAAVLLFLIVLGVIAAARAAQNENSSRDDSKEKHPYLDDGKDVYLTSIEFIGDDQGTRDGELSIVDRGGRLLVTADALERVTFHNVGPVASLLEAKQVHHIDQPLTIRLRQNGVGQYRIEDFQVTESPSDGERQVFYRRLYGKLYKAEVCTDANRCVDVEIVQTQAPDFADDSYVDEHLIRMADEQMRAPRMA